MSRVYATTNSHISEREKRNMRRSRNIAAQGMVLLENDGVLPLAVNKQNIALYGNGGRNTVKGGTGSGDVNSRLVVNIEQGLEEAGYNITTKRWLEEYAKSVEEAEKKYNEEIRKLAEIDAHAADMRTFTHPFKEPAVGEVTQGDLEQSDTDTAIYVLSRNSGEGKDRTPAEGDYELFESEKEAIRRICGYYKKVVVVLNVGGVIDTKFFRETQGIGALLLMSQAGNIGGCALADVLTGKVTPSGHLASTWAENYTDYPSAKTFAAQNGNLDDEYYEEGIYVGYRFFDTFGVTPAYPFGYGKSYTAFEVKTKKVSLSGNTVEIVAEVKNTGDTYAGKEVVQVYYSSPAGRLEKPYQELAAYGKTKLLQPGESQDLVLAFQAETMASYDTSSASYVLEAGIYYIRVGTHSRNTKIAAGLILGQEVVTECLTNLIKPDAEIALLSAEDAVPYTYEGEAEEKAQCEIFTLDAGKLSFYKAAYQKENKELPGTDKTNKITADDVLEKRATLDELVSQLTIPEMAELCVGTARHGLGSSSVVGAASTLCPGAAGDTSCIMIDDRNIRNLVLADGPAGLRLKISFVEEGVQYYQFCTAIPIAVLLAQTWDVDLIEEAGDIVGEEMNELGVTLWLAPGMNIHRNPLCGRNFEYYSEDPLVSGKCAAADTRGVQKHPGIGTTIKHFALNNQEDNRMHTNAHIDERTIREIYLKGFEIAVRESQPMAIMTSYNLINGIHAANHYDLLTAIARDEWGFAGIIMTDWGTTGGIEMEPGKTFKYAPSNAAGCVKAGNDLTMPGKQEDVDEIIRSVGAKEGEVPCPLTLGDLQACAKRILSIVLQSSVYDQAPVYDKAKR